jgi:catechol 2,3-dioxygenase-like lactoylglutathione lyase family enzyme
MFVCVLGSRLAGQEPSAPIQFWTGIGELVSITIYVPDQEQALDWYTERLGFEVRVDEWYAADERFVAIAPPGQDHPLIVLEDVSIRGNPQYAGQVGAQGGWVFHVADLVDTYMRLWDLSVRFTETPIETPLGMRAKFVDLLGNEWTLLQPPELTDSEG